MKTLLVGLAMAGLFALLGFAAAALQNPLESSQGAAGSIAGGSDTPALGPSDSNPPLEAPPVAPPAPLELETVVVCVLDTGVRATHADIAPYYAAGMDFTGSGAGPIDDNGHGTQVAARVIQGFQQSIPDAPASALRLLIGKVATADGKFLWKDLAAGIEWCRSRDADLINLSLGDVASDGATASALEAASDAGILVVAAAGNNGPCDDCLQFPARDAHVLSVGCVDAQGARCSFSATGAELDLVAPGLSISVASFQSDSSHALRSGTSIAAPYVSGLAAALRGLHPDWTTAQIRDQLQESALDLGESGPDATFGFGLAQPSTG